MDVKARRFNKFNGKVQRISKRPKKLKRRLNNWWFRKFLNQISYKCVWRGVKTIESKHTRGSSSTCPICGCKLMKYPKGLVECEKHGLMSRHIVACLNLLRWEGVLVRPRLPLECSREPSPNKPYGDEDKLGEPKRGSCVPQMQHWGCNGLSRHPQTQQNQVLYQSRISSTLSSSISSINGIPVTLAALTLSEAKSSLLKRCSFHFLAPAISCFSPTPILSFRYV